jgi:hypothetical protein
MIYEPKLQRRTILNNEVTPDISVWQEEVAAQWP